MHRNGEKLFLMLEPRRSCCSTAFLRFKLKCSFNSLSEANKNCKRSKCDLVEIVEHANGRNIDGKCFSSKLFMSIHVGVCVCANESLLHCRMHLKIACCVLIHNR